MLVTQRARARAYPAIHTLIASIDGVTCLPASCDSRSAGLGALWGSRHTLCRFQRFTTFCKGFTRWAVDLQAARVKGTVESSTAYMVVVYRHGSAIRKSIDRNPSQNSGIQFLLIVVSILSFVGPLRTHRSRKIRPLPLDPEPSQSRDRLRKSAGGCYAIGLDGIPVLRDHASVVYSRSCTFPSLLCPAPRASFFCLLVGHALSTRRAVIKCASSNMQRLEERHWLAGDVHPHLERELHSGRD
jgi:hypothetical protein